jgi:predicted  nucleic acid-binding Zn-ribbon protein
VGKAKKNKELQNHFHAEQLEELIRQVADDAPTEVLSSESVVHDIPSLLAQAVQGDSGAQGVADPASADAATQVMSGEESPADLDKTLPPSESMSFDPTTANEPDPFQPVTRQPSTAAGPGALEKTFVVQKKSPHSSPESLEREPKRKSLSVNPGQEVSSMAGAVTKPTEPIRLLDVAQKKIVELESELDRVREELELAILAARSHKEQVEDYEKQLAVAEKKRQEALEQAQLELNLLRQSLAEREKEKKALRAEVEALKAEIAGEIRHIRHRERELENRLELLKSEKQALLRSKDDMILSLKKKNADLEADLNRWREKNKEAQTHIQQLTEQKHKAIRTLRLLLTHLDIENEGSLSGEDVPLKKVKG